MNTNRKVFLTFSPSSCWGQLRINSVTILFPLNATKLLIFSLRALACRTLNFSPSTSTLDPIKTFETHDVRGKLLCVCVFIMQECQQPTFFIDWSLVVFLLRAKKGILDLFPSTKTTATISIYGDWNCDYEVKRPLPQFRSRL